MSDFDDLMTDAAGLLMDHLGSRTLVTVIRGDRSELQLRAIVGRLSRREDESVFANHSDDEIIESCYIRVDGHYQVAIGSAVRIEKYGDEVFTVTSVGRGGPTTTAQLQRVRKRQIRSTFAERR